MTLTEITNQLEAAVKSSSEKRAALITAKKVVADLEVANGAILAGIRKLHEEYQSIMKDILTLGGTIHS